MSNDEKDVIEYRLTTLEKQYNELRGDLKEVKDVLNRLDKRFAGIPEGVALNCQLHANLVAEMRKEIDNHQVLIDGLLAFKWKAVGIVSVVVLVMQLFGATLADKLLKRDVSPIPVRIELVTHGTNTVPVIK